MHGSQKKRFIFSLERTLEQKSIAHRSPFFVQDQSPPIGMHNSGKKWPVEHTLEQKSITHRSPFFVRKSARFPKEAFLRTLEQISIAIHRSPFPYSKIKKIDLLPWSRNRSPTDRHCLLDNREDRSPPIGMHDSKKNWFSPHWNTPWSRNHHIIDLLVERTWTRNRSLRIFKYDLLLKKFQLHLNISKLNLCFKKIFPIIE